MAQWQVTLARTDEVCFTVDIEDVEAWWPDLRKMSGDSDEVFIGSWADRLLVDWDTGEIQDGDEPLDVHPAPSVDNREGVTVQEVAG